MAVHHLDRALHRLRARIGKEGALETADFRQALGQRPLILVVVKVGSVDQQSGLLANRRDNPRMRVSQRVHADAGDEIQVAVAFQIVNRSRSIVCWAV